MTDPRTDALRLWLRFQLAIDVLLAIVLLLTPLTWLARLPEGMLLPGQPFTVRLFGLYAGSLAACWWLASRDPMKHREAALLGTTIRLLGALAFVIGAAEDWFGWMPREETQFDVFGIAKVEIAAPPHEPQWPPFLRVTGFSEAVFGAINLWLLKRSRIL